MNEVLKRLNELDIKANEHLGQHFLIDETALQFIANQAHCGANIIEIGSGIGNLTKRLAPRANRVIGVEIDRRFEPALEQAVEDYQNVSIVYEDALKFDYNGLFSEQRRSKRSKGRHERDETDWQLIANLPYHITEPFPGAVADIPFADIVLTVGKRAAESLTTRSPSNLAFTKTSLIAMAFFDVEKIADLNKQMFYPVPRTSSAVIRLIPLMHSEEARGHARYILRELLLKENKMTVGQALRIALESQPITSHRGSSKNDRNRYERREVRRMLSGIVYQYSQADNLNQYVPQSELTRRSSIELPDNIASSRLSTLNNSQIRTLVSTIIDKYRFV